MARVAFTKDELRGYATVWLVDLVFAGQTVRVATRVVTVETAGGDTVQYAGTLDEVVYERSLDLFTTSPEPESIVVSGIFPLDIAGCEAEGHQLEGAAVQVSQVRVHPSGDGAVVDTWEERCIRLSGRVVDATYGESGDDGAYARFSAERNLFDSNTQIPYAHHRVNRQTWKTSGRVGSADLNVYYPWIIGYPGRDSVDPDGWFPGSRAVWINKQLLFQVLCLGVGPVEASTVFLATDDDPNGVEVNVRYTYTSGGAVQDARDKLGTLLAVVDYNQDGYGDSADPDYLAASYRPEVSEDAHVFVGWPAGSGGLLWRGRVLRDAGDVLEWAMEQGGIPVDYPRWQAARSALAWCKVDCAVDDAINPVEWATSNVLPLLPVSLYFTENGVAPWVWRPDARPEDAVCHLDADADPRLDVADTVTRDASNQANTFELQYGYNRRTENYRYTARLGPKRIETTAQAESRIILTNGTGSKRIAVYARETGPAGTGIIVITTVTGGVLSVSENLTTRTVTINVKSATDTAEDVAAAINATSTLIEAETDDDSGVLFTGTGSPSVTLVLPDFGTAGHPVAARSLEACKPGDRPGPDAGVRRRTAETRVLYDHGSAAHSLEWQAAAFGLPIRRIEVEGPEEDYGWIGLGDEITLTRLGLGFDETCGNVETLSLRSDGTVGFRLVFIDSR